MAIGPTEAIGPIERKALNIPCVNDDDDGSIGPAKRHQSGSSGTNGRKALSIGPSGGPGDDHPAQLIVRTQKRLEAPQVGLRLDNEARR